MVVGALAAAIAVLTCFCFSKELVVFLEAPVASQGVRFLQLSPGEFFFTTLKVGFRAAAGVALERHNSILSAAAPVLLFMSSHLSFLVATLMMLMHWESFKLPRQHVRWLFGHFLSMLVRAFNSADVAAAQVAGYAGLLLATPTVLYEVVSYVVPGLTKSEKDLLAPIVFGSSILFYVGWDALPLVLCGWLAAVQVTCNTRKRCRATDCCPWHGQMPSAKLPCTNPAAGIFVSKAGCVLAAECNVIIPLCPVACCFDQTRPALACPAGCSSLTRS